MYHSPIYKAATIKPATTAARPNSTLPAAPVASGRPPEPVALPEGLGPPVAAGTVPLLLPCPFEPVGYIETRVEPEVPVGLWDEPVAVFEPEAEEMAVAITGPVSMRSWKVEFAVLDLLVRCVTAHPLQKAVLTNINIHVVANVRDRLHGSLGVVAAELGHLGAQVLGLADSLNVGRVLVLVDSAEEAARGASHGKLSEREEGRGENGTSEHSCG